ncbi:MAG: hypothetical protein ACO25B_12525 [Chitinophagaceae bacterium]
MEVHAHAHTARKKWVHYLWEFLMLFLAVFCGFLAEYQLEHKIEKDREKDYILSMTEDLQKDTANFTAVIQDFREYREMLAIVLRGMDSNLTGHTANWPETFIASVKRGYADFFYTDRTLQQLKNSGGLRLIRNKKAANGIIDYDAAIKDYYIEEKFLSESQSRFVEAVDKMWSFREMFRDLGILQWSERKDRPIKKNYWLQTDKQSFEYLYNKISVFSSFMGGRIMQLILTKQKSADLITMLKKEYRLK